jgi:hypothetical protein
MTVGVNQADLSDASKDGAVEVAKDIYHKLQKLCV